MKKVLMKLLWISWLFGGLLMAAGVQLKVSSTRVARGQSVKVKIEAEGSDVRFPAVDRIGTYAVENLRQSSKLESRYINGTFSSSTKKILSFEFYPEKTVIIPSLEVEVDGKKYRTRKTKVEVVEGSASAAGGFGITMHTDKKSVYPGEPLIVTVDAAEPLNGAIVQMQYSPPEFKGFFVKPLGGENQIRKGNVTIHRLTYLLTPQREGKLQIEPAKVRVGMRDLNAPADPFGIFGTPVKWIALRSNALNIDVKPLPTAADLVGHFSLKASVDRRKVKANEPVNYTLEIVGEGSLEDLADPRFDIPGVTVYGDDAVVESSVKKGKLYSRYTKKYVFISEKNFRIPSLKMTEFDYQTGKSRTLKTPAFGIDVRGSAASASTGASAGMNSRGSTPASAVTGSAEGTVRPSGNGKKEDLLNDPAYYARKAYEEKTAKLPWYLAGAFGAGMVLMLLAIRLWPRKKRSTIFGLSKGRHYSLEEALRILYPHINDDPEAERVVRYLYQVKNGNSKAQIDRKALDRLTAKYDRDAAKA